MSESHSQAKVWLVTALGPMVAILAGCGLLAGGEDQQSSTPTETDGIGRPLFSTIESESAGPRSDGGGLADPSPDSALRLEINSDVGELVWVHHQEPPDLHVDDPDNGADITAWIRQGLLEGLFGVDKNLAYYPELLAKNPGVVANSDRTVTVEYELRGGLMWSDGEALTAEDVAYTHGIITEGCPRESDGSIVDASNDGCLYELDNRFGYDLVTSFDVTSDTTFSVKFASFFPGWRDMYNQVFAQHAFGADALEVNDNLRNWSNEAGTLPSSGPLTFTGWQRGAGISLDRNDSYHGSQSPDVVNQGSVASVNGVLIAFVADHETRMDLITSGQAHLMIAPLHTRLDVLASAPNFKVNSTPGPTYEHIAMNLLNPHLAKAGVREAVAYAVDKSAIVAQIYEPLVGSILAPEGLGNAYWMTNQAPYQDHQANYSGHNLDGVTKALTEAGYERGPGGVWVHESDGPLELRLGTTAGDPIRDAQVGLIAEQLTDAGFQIVDNSAPGGLFYEQGPFAEDAIDASSTGGAAGNADLWDLAVFSWTTGPWPGSISGVFRGNSPVNPYGIDEPQLNVKATDCDAQVDDTTRADCYNELDTFVTSVGTLDVSPVVIPLTQRPMFSGYNSDVLSSGAVILGFTAGGPLVNVVDYQIS